MVYILTKLLIILILLLPLSVEARTAFQYLAPDGSLVYTDEELEPPFRLVSKLKLTWGDIKSEEIERKIVKEHKPDFQSKAMNHRKYAEIVSLKARKYRLLPELLHAVIEAESAYDAKAVSRAGAVGLMQLMPLTAKRMGVIDRTDPEQNVDGGARYLRELLDLFDNDLVLAIASYNAGEKAIINYGRNIPPYRETQNYVVRVLKNFRRNMKTRTMHKNKQRLGG